MDKNKNKKIRQQLKKLRHSDKAINIRQDKAEERMGRIEKSLLGLEAILHYELDILQLKVASLEEQQNIVFTTEGVTVSDANSTTEQPSQPEAEEAPVDKDGYLQNQTRKQFIEDARKYFEENEHKLRFDVVEMSGRFDYRVELNSEKRIVELLIRFIGKSGKAITVEVHKSKAMYEDVFNFNIGMAICLAKALKDDEMLKILSDPPAPAYPVEGTEVSKKNVIRDDSFAQY